MRRFIRLAATVSALALLTAACAGDEPAAGGSDQSSTTAADFGTAEQVRAALQEGGLCDPATAVESVRLPIASSTYNRIQCGPTDPSTAGPKVINILTFRDARARSEMLPVSERSGAYFWYGPDGTLWAAGSPDKALAERAEKVLGPMQRGAAAR